MRIEKTRRQRKPLDWDAPRLFVTSMQLVGVRSNFFAVFAKCQFIPIGPYGYNEYGRNSPKQLEREVGAIVRFSKKGRITKVIRRVIHLAGKVKR